MKSLRFLLVTVAFAIVLPATGFSQASVLLDQIGDTSGNTTQFGVSRLSQQFPDFPNSSIGNIDDFTAASFQLRLSNVSAAMNSVNANGYLNISMFRVEFYSTPAAAASNLTGDVGTVLVPFGSALLTPFSHTPNQNDMLVSLAIDFLLPSAGTYWLAVIPVANSTDAFYIYDSSLPGNFNSAQANPGGDFGFPGNLLTNNTNAAYRILAIPEPGTIVAGLGMLLVAAGAIVRRRRLTAV